MPLSGPASLGVLLGLLFVKEGGLPVPVPGDLLVLGAGVAAAGQGPPALALLGAILVAGFLGGTLQFLLVRDALRLPMLRLLGRVGLPIERIETLASRLRRGGARSVAAARATPGVRVGAIAASGLAALPLGVFVRGLVAGNTAFVGGHFLLGYLIGAPAVALVASAGALAVGLGLVVVLGVVGLAGLGAFRRRRRDRAPGAPPSAAWLEAACPACLALDLVAGGEAARGRA